MIHKKVPFIEQIEHSECGLACVAMILGYYQHNVGLIDLREEFGVPRGGHTLSNLSEILNQKDCATKGFRTTIQDLKEFKLPVILFWEQKHFVILEKISKKKFYIIDPAYGRIKLTKEKFETSYSNILLTVTPKKKLPKIAKESNIRFLVNYAFKQPSLIIKIVVLTLCVQLLSITVPYITAHITDDIVLKANYDQLTIIGLLIGILFIAYLLISLARVFIISRLQTTMDCFMMTTFMQHLLKLPYRFFENRSNGELIFRANSNVYIRQILSNRTITLLVDSLLLFIYFILMLRISIDMSFIVLILGGIILGFLLLSSNITRNLSKQNIHTQTKVQNKLTESITGIVDIKMMGNEDTIFHEWKEHFENQLKHTEKQNNWTGSIGATTTAIQFIFTLFLLWYGTYKIFNSELSLGTLLAFNSLALSFITPLVSIGTTYIDLVVVGTFIQRLNDIIKATPEITNSQKMMLQKINGQIEFKNVSFRFDSFSDDTIKNVSFIIQPGEKVAIVGASGSGKSTIAKLLLGLYEPTDGYILMDGNPLNNLNRRELRKRMGAVLQDVSLFNKSILENIITDVSDINIENAVAAAKLACIYDDIIKYPTGFFTLVSENGLNFSGGQKQRLLLARALAKNPSILILDEATSAVDSLTENKIYRKIKTELACTTIIITHRLSTILEVDKILFVHQGSIKEVGSFKELMTLKGMFYELYQSQNKLEESIYDTNNINI